MRLLVQFREGHPWAPGGYPFTDNRTGRKFDGSSADLKMQAQNVIQHRRANPHIYPLSEPKYLDLDWVMLEIEDQICMGNPSVCGDEPKPRPDPTFVFEMPKEPCACGSTDFEPNLCKSCGGNKITSWTCRGCGNKKS